jgi:hypothetical protein
MAGIGTNWGLTGQAPTAESIGISVGSALGGAVLGYAASKHQQMVAMAETEGEAGRDGRGIPRYGNGQGGASSSGSGGAEGASGGPNKPINPGTFLEQNGDGSYRVSGEFMKHFGEAFRAALGYDPSRARIEFGWALGDPAMTFNDTIIIDPGKGWGSWDKVAQAEVLVHEMTHCVQFDKAGAAAVLARRAVEDFRYGKAAYVPSAALKAIVNLRALNVVDSRFTIESVATYVEQRLTADYAEAALRRR